jgi:hypothetical protein
MRPSVSRRQFLTAQAALAAGLAAASAQEPPKDAAPKAPPRPRPPKLDAELVQKFVVAAHRDLEQVKQLLAEQPRLINATWDWGAGDFETALGGAAHMGRRDVALFLLGQGARLDVFAAAMLGQLDVVKAAVTANPGIVKVPGPHGIPLLAHAKAGKQEAEAVLKYLEALPA